MFSLVQLNPQSGLYLILKINKPYILGALPAQQREEPNALLVAALFLAPYFLLFLSSVISLYNVSTNSLINFIPLLSSLFSQKIKNMQGEGFEPSSTEYK